MIIHNNITLKKTGSTISKAQIIFHHEKSSVSGAFLFVKAKNRSLFYNYGAKKQNQQFLKAIFDLISLYIESILRGIQMRTSIKKAIAFTLTLCATSAGTIEGKFTLSPTPIAAETAETVKISNYKYICRSYKVNPAYMQKAPPT